MTDKKPKLERINVSASQISKRRRCLRCVGFEYVEGHFPPSSTKQQFGTDVHKHLERWLSKAIVPGESPAEMTAKQGIQSNFLPAPDDSLLVEKKFEFPWHEAANIYVKGFKDVEKPPEKEDGFVVGPPIVIDHKTTSDLRWAMSVEDLKKDAQAILYSLDCMFKYNTPFVLARWVYYAASNPKNGRRKPKGAIAVETTFDSQNIKFREQVGEVGRDIMEIVHIRRNKIPGLELPPSPEGCQMYGGCFHAERCNLDPKDRIAGHIARAEVLK